MKHKERQELAEHRKTVIRTMIRQGYGSSSIAEELGISRQAVWLLMRRHNLDDGIRRNAPENYEYYFTNRYRRGKVKDQ